MQITRTIEHYRVARFESLGFPFWAGKTEDHAWSPLAVIVHPVPKALQAEAGERGLARIDTSPKLWTVRQR